MAVGKQGQSSDGANELLEAVNGWVKVVSWPSE